MSFSSINRESLIKNIDNQQFDVLVIGGGITGAGIALDAASRGLKVVLIEIDDFASGTSSRSTKLVHGGLRYLEKLQFKFVAQLGRERKILYNNATHNVIPIPVVLPIVKGGQLNKSLTYFALKIYDFLAGVKKEYKARWISKTKLLAEYPFLNGAGLVGAFKYNEYKTNDGRLVIETLKKACNYGAICLNLIETKSLIYSQNKVQGAIVKNLLQNTEFSIRANCVVNACGPWSEAFINSFDSGMDKSLYPTKGIHFVVSKDKFPLSEAFYFDTHDQRMVFAIPRQDFVYVGTTDTPFQGDLRNIEITTDDIDYLLKVVNHKFSGLKLNRESLISAWAGVRPLIKDNKKKPGEISRKEELFVSPSGLITIVGGKLTGYRLMAKKVVDSILSSGKINWVRCSTANIRLSGSQWENSPSLQKLVEFADHKFDEAKQTGIQPSEFKKLFYRYGTNIDMVTEKAYEFLNHSNQTDEVWLKAELWYAINYEMLVDISGFFIYRTEMVLFELDKINKHLTFVANCMAEFLNWDATEKASQIIKFKRHWEQYQIPKI